MINVLGITEDIINEIIVSYQLTNLMTYLSGDNK